MPRPIKAHLFWVNPEGETSGSISTKIRDFIRTANSVAFVHNQHEHSAVGLVWSERDKTLTGSVMLRRNNLLPEEVRGTTVRELRIAPDADLGEPMCFAYCPQISKALVHYSHHGARHSVLTTLLGKMAIECPLTIQPVLEEDLLTRLASKRVIRAIEFALSGSQVPVDLAQRHASIKQAISLTNELRGVKVSVAITMSHDEGGLDLAETRSLAAALKRAADDDPAASGIHRVVVKGSDDDDTPCEELDLLRARRTFEFVVNERGRHLDRAQCQRMLAQELNGLRRDG